MSLAHRVARGAILRAAESPRVNRFVTRHGMRLGARRYVPAETLDEIVPIFRDLNARGARAATGPLRRLRAARPPTSRATRPSTRARSTRLAAEGLDANTALKLTHLGVYFDPELMFASIARLLDAAAQRGMRLRIDMEESALVDATLALYRRLRASGRDNVGIVLQSYLHRSPDDLEALLALGLNVRIVKGAYLEPAAARATRTSADDRRRLRALLERALPHAAFTAIATHDPAMIAAARAIIEREQIPRDRYEFQMIYGIGMAEQRRVLAAGLPLRVVIPYGPTWFGYLMRRLAERPANLTFFLRGALQPLRSSSGSRTIGASTRAPAATSSAPRATAATSSGRRSEKDSIPSWASIPTAARPSGICDGLRSPSPPRIDSTTGKPSP